jgi:hypothetical protein
MGHTSGALRSRNFASSARGLRPDGKTPRWRGGWVKSNRTSQAVLGGCNPRTVIAWVHKLPCFKPKGWRANFKCITAAVIILR